jgi:hypothetical protein
MKNSLQVALLLTVAMALPLQAQRPRPSTTKSSTLSAAEISQVHAAFRATVQSPATRAAVRTAVLRQLRRVDPIAHVNGHWVVPIDVAAIYNDPAVRTALIARLGSSPLAGRLNQLTFAGAADRLGLAFIPNQFGDQILGTSVGQVRGSLAKALFLQNTTDLMPGVTLDGARAGLTGARVMFDLGTGILSDIADAFTNWWSGSAGPKDPNTGLELDDPNADPDGDGVPNRLDGDDDGDGTSDEDDQAPYDPGTQICYDCMGRAKSAVFTNTAAAGVLKLVFTSHAATGTLASSNRLVSLGTIGQNVALQIGFGSDLH